MNFQAHSLLGQTKGERKAFFGGCKKEGYIVRLPPRALGCRKRWKVSPFVKFEIIRPLLCFLLNHFTNNHWKIWSSSDKFVDRFQDLSKVKNPAVSKAKVYQLLRVFKRKCFGKYDVVTLSMLYLKVLHDIVSQNSSINFSEAAIMS